MKLFTICPCESTQGVIIDFGENINNKLSRSIYEDEFFFLNDESILNGSSQLVDFKLICNDSDYLDCIIGLPVFSSKAKEVLKNVAELSFKPIKIDGISGFHICSINKVQEMVDLEMSKYRELTDGNKIISSYSYKVPVNDFYIAKDKNYPYKYLVSDEFVKLCNEGNLNIVFEEVVIGKPKSFF